MNNMRTKSIKNALFASLLLILPILNSCTPEENTQYIDPTIGNVSRFLVPTYPTMHLPNQMVRMFPVKLDYISDQVDGIPPAGGVTQEKGNVSDEVSPGRDH